jgi:capsular exopolysaccharide synthesis family protein
MSKFLKALQRADEQRLLHEQPWRVDTDQESGHPQPRESRAASPDTAPKVSVPFLRRVDQDQAHPRPQPGEAQTATPETGLRAPFSSPPVNPPEVLDHVDAHCVSLLRPATFEAEQYRTLRYIVEQAHQKRNLSVVAVSSPSSGEGKSVTTINLAGAFAQAHDAKVLLIDADLRQPSVARLLGLSTPDGPGLVDTILNPNLSLQEVVRPCPPSHLFVLPAGRSTASSYEVLKSPRMGEVLAEARRQYDYIIVDTPPLIPLPDCRLLGKWVDGFFVVVAAHKTSRKLVEEALQVVDASLMLGLVFNRDDRPMTRYGSYGSSYFSFNGHHTAQRNGVKSVGGNLLRRGMARPEHV